MTQEEYRFVGRVFADLPQLAAAIDVARRLRHVLRRLDGEMLHEVLTEAEATMLAPLATSLRRDLPAVQAALDLPWTTSPVEGQISRLKMINRTMYGRAGFELLRARVLSAV